VSGRPVEEAVLLEQLIGVLPAIVADLEAADRDPEPLDKTPLAVWLAEIPVRVGRRAPQPSRSCPCPRAPRSCPDPAARRRRRRPAVAPST